MKLVKYIVIVFLSISIRSFSQPLFDSPDTLLVRTFESVGKRDHQTYLSLLNKKEIFKNKKAISSSDSMMVLKPFTDAFTELIASLADMSSTPDFTVAYQGYELMKIKAFDTKTNGKIMMHVNLLINNAFIIKMPFIMFASSGKYSMETPMMVMFYEQKE